MSRSVIFLLLLSTTACSGQRGSNFVNTTDDIGVLPQDFKKSTEDYVRGRLKDPDSAKVQVGDGYSSSCNQGVYGKWYGWAVPVNFNGKNSYGAYVGFEIEYVWWANGRIARITRTLSDCNN